MPQVRPRFRRRLSLAKAERLPSLAALLLLFATVVVLVFTTPLELGRVTQVQTSEALGGVLVALKPLLGEAHPLLLPQTLLRGPPIIGDFVLFLAKPGEPVASDALLVSPDWIGHLFTDTLDRFGWPDEETAALFVLGGGVIATLLPGLVLRSFAAAGIAFTAWMTVHAGVMVMDLPIADPLEALLARHASTAFAVAYAVFGFRAAHGTGILTRSAAAGLAFLSTQSLQIEPGVLSMLLPFAPVVAAVIPRVFISAAGAGVVALILISAPVPAMFAAGTAALLRLLFDNASSGMGFSYTPDKLSSDGSFPIEDVLEEVNA